MYSHPHQHAHVRVWTDFVAVVRYFCTFRILINFIIVYVYTEDCIHCVHRVSCSVQWCCLVYQQQHLFWLRYTCTVYTTWVFSTIAITSSVHTWNCALQSVRFVYNYSFFSLFLRCHWTSSRGCRIKFLCLASFVRLSLSILMPFFRVYSRCSRAAVFTSYIKLNMKPMCIIAFINSVQV